MLQPNLGQIILVNMFNARLFAKLLVTHSHQHIGFPWPNQTVTEVSVTYRGALWEELVLIASTKSSAVLTASFFVLWEFRR